MKIKKLPPTRTEQSILDREKKTRESKSGDAQGR